MNLEKLYKMQEELDKYILENNEVEMSEEELLDNTILALLVEVGELANTTRCFKHWSKKGMMEKEVVLDELADVWHFYLSIGNQLKSRFSYGGYKLLANHQRELTLQDLNHHFKEIYNQALNKQLAGLGAYLCNLALILGFTDKEVEQAYLKKHEENYKRQSEGY